MHGAAVIINDMWDKDIDKQVERTRNRPLVTGEISPLKAKVLLGLTLSGAALCLTQLNYYT